MTTPPPNAAGATSIAPTDLASLLAWITDGMRPQPIDVTTSVREVAGSAQAIALPKGLELRSLKPILDDWLPRPERVTETVTLHTIDSLIAWTKRFVRPETALFLDPDPKQPSITAIIDYHGLGAYAEADWKWHRGTYAFPLSSQFTEWRKFASGKLHDQADFAMFLEDRLHDVVAPPADWMLVDAAQRDVICELLQIQDDMAQIDDAAEDPPSTDDEDPDREAERRGRSRLYKLRRLRFGRPEKIGTLARSLEVHVNSKSKTAVDPRTGRREIVFQEDHEQRGGNGERVVFPDLFLVQIPLWAGEAPMLMPVRIYYRVVTGAVKFALTVPNIELLLRRAIDAEAARVAAGVGRPVYYGTGA